MSFVLTLISTERTKAVTQDLMNRCKTALPKPETPQWLAEDIACDIPFGGADNIEAIEAKIRDIIGTDPVDIAVLEIENRRKQLLIADMDSTIIEQECIDEMGDVIGIGDKIAAITEKAMRGELNFEAALKERVSYLKGSPATIIDDILADRITLTPGAKTLVKTMNQSGAVTALVSGGFTQFTKDVAARTGFANVQANELLIAEGKLTGRVREPILGQDAKREALTKLCKENGLNLAQALAVGDGANDLAMINEAGLGVAFHAKPAVAKAARVRIDHADLTALLYLQGIPRKDFK